MLLAENRTGTLSMFEFCQHDDHRFLPSGLELCCVDLGTHREPSLPRDSGGWRLKRSGGKKTSMCVKQLAEAKARQAPSLLQTSLAAALISSWPALLSHAAMHAFAASLLAQDCSSHTNVEGNQPLPSQVLAEAPLHATNPSRPPADS